MIWEIYLNAAEGFLELGMFEEAHDELERMPAEDRYRPEVYATRLGVFLKLEKWEAAEVCAKHLTRVWSDQSGWWCAWAFATRRSVSVEAAEKILIQALVRFPEDALIYYHLACYTCVMGRTREAKSLFAEAINRDESYLQDALDEADLKAIRDEIGRMG